MGTQPDPVGASPPAPPAMASEERPRQWLLGALFFAGVATFVVALVLLVTESVDTAAGLLTALAGLFVAAAAGALHQARELYRSLKEWRELFRDGGPDSMRVKALEPPPGFLLRRDATVTMSVEKDGRERTVERAIPVPVTHALLWRTLGRIPTRIGKLTDRREMDVPVWKRRRRDHS